MPACTIDRTSEGVKAITPTIGRWLRYKEMVFASDQRYPHLHEGGGGGGGGGVGGGLEADRGGDGIRSYDLDCWQACMESCSPRFDQRRPPVWSTEDQRTRTCGRVCAYECGYAVLV